MPLTDTAILEAKPAAKAFKLSDERGLFLLVDPSGGKWWRFRYMFRRKHKSLSMGVYPDVSLDHARELRDQARKLLRDGTDPSEQRKVDKAAKRAEEARQIAATGFTLDNDGVLSLRLGTFRLTLTPAETVELRVFLNATRRVAPRVPR